MKSLLLASLLLLVACGKSSDLSSDDMDYIRTSVDVLRARTALPLGTDSVTMQHALASVYARHNTTPAKYKAATVTLAEDAPRAQKMFEAIRDSLKRK